MLKLPNKLLPSTAPSYPLAPDSEVPRRRPPSSDSMGLDEKIRRKWLSVLDAVIPSGNQTWRKILDINGSDINGKIIYTYHMLLESYLYHVWFPEVDVL